MAIKPIKPKNANRLVFRRMDNIGVKAYVVTAHEKVNGKVISKEIARIENPPNINAVKIQDIFDYNSEGKYKLHEPNIILDDTYRMKLMINDKTLNRLLYSVDTVNSVVEIDYSEIGYGDTIKIEYYIDAVMFEHETSNPCEYSITVEFDHSLNTIGHHNLLK